MPFMKLLCMCFMMYRLSVSDVQHKVKELGVLDPLLKHPQEVRHRIAGNFGKVDLPNWIKLAKF